MPDTESKSRGPLYALALAVALLAASVLGLRWWQSRADRQSESLAGIGRILPGSVTQARQKVDPGRNEKAVLEAIGKPSVGVETKGDSRHSVWTYYYADGTMTLTLTDGIIARADLDYGPPRRATPGRDP
jgi:hypothetical protein